jgi:hypothetical protein
MGGVPISHTQPRARNARLQVSRIGVPSGSRGNSMAVFRCHSCGEVIGVYEPLVVLEQDGPRTTSRAAEPDLRTGVAHYHRDCATTGAARQAAPNR